MARGRRSARGLAAGLSFLRVRFGHLWLLFAALLALGVSGLPKVTFDNALLRFFESDFPAYAEFVEVSRDFESDSNDVILLFEADDLADPVVLEAASAVLLEAQFIDGVRAAISPFSIEIAAEDGRTEPLVPYPPPDAARMAERFDAVRGETPALRRLLAEDRAAMIAVLPLVAEEAVQADALAALAALVERAEGGGEIRVRLAGYPVLRAKLAQGLILDVILLNAIGAAVGFVVASIALRSVALGVLTLPGPLIALVLCLGVFGHLGVAVTTVSVTLPVLVMILATIDSIHIIFERTRQGDRESRRATLRAVRRIAAACVFAAITTAIAFAVLTLSRAEIIAELGAMGAGVLLLSVVMVLLTQSLVLAAAGRRPYFREKFARVAQRPPSGWRFIHLPRVALSQPRGVTLAAITLLAAALVVYSQAGPRYFVLDSLAEHDPLRITFNDVEEKVSPISMLEVAVRGTSPALLGAVEASIAEVTGSDLVQSAASVAGTAPGGIDGAPDVIAGRLLSQDETRALVTVPFRYQSGAETLALAARVDAALAENPALAGAEISPATGMSVMSAAVISGILTELNRGLAIAVLAVAVLIGLWLRSARIALIALIPNLLPVALIGGWLAFSGQGIELANGLALTVAFGVAVDDTLHVLNRIRLSGGFARIEPARLRAAMREATPVLVTTSAVLVLGFGGSAFAATQEVADFGTIATSVFVLALFADLLVLPAAVAFLGPRFYLSARKGQR
ncbi:efflux RND transporter permease subunit [Sinisalibacter lacisalsi]|uniref:SSD domain-containing protein n=1 Tax=Sinisalibacter lacisalsi TaxID=1526570 RepID=A0ABQ1QRK1_9RHOB|nr:MMPL family transporter [Sinisalibacter lacisalsi]GGD39390.1 hypothetical protein GCM10011358_24150 [Sinisalibacter lacisalsi]